MDLSTKETSVSDITPIFEIPSTSSANKVQRSPRRTVAPTQRRPRRASTFHTNYKETSISPEIKITDTVKNRLKYANYFVEVSGRNPEKVVILTKELWNHNIDIVWARIKEILLVASKNALTLFLNILLMYQNQWESKNSSGETLIFQAMKAGSERAVRFLLKKGADSKVLNNNGQDIFYEAVASGQQGLVQALTSNGVRPTSQVCVFETALTYKASKLMSYLLACDITPINATQVLKRAIQLSDIEAIKQLYTIREVNSLLGFLHEAVNYGSTLETVQTLLDRGQPIEERNAEGMTALHTAIVTRRHNMVRYLIERGADVEARTRKTNESCLYLSIRVKNVHAAILCMQQGVTLEGNIEELRATVATELRINGDSILLLLFGLGARLYSGYAGPLLIPHCGPAAMQVLVRRMALLMHLRQELPMPEVALLKIYPEYERLFDQCITTLQNLQEEEKTSGYRGLYSLLTGQRRKTVYEWAKKGAVYKLIDMVEKTPNLYQKETAANMQITLVEVQLRRSFKDNNIDENHSLTEEEVYMHLREECAVEQLVV